MGGSTVVDAREHTAAESLERSRDGERVVVRADLLGSTRELTLRYDGRYLYGDTPTRLHRHETAAEMAPCMRDVGYVWDDDGR